MGTQFLLQRLAGCIGTYLVGATAEQHGLRLPLLVAIALAMIAWGVTYRRRQVIVDAFQPPAAEPTTALAGRA
jgi:hypothetical protein